MKIKILIPVYNDWQSVSKLLENINSVISSLSHEFSVIIVNDASTETRSEITANLENLKSIQIINMKENTGHARCVASGLKYIYEKEEFDYVIPMDGDGEDRPEELNLLFKKSNENPLKTVTADRIKRSEGLLFKLMYGGHKILTYVFTGQFIKFGNYCSLPKEAATKLIKEACIWSSFSGSVTKIISDRVSVPSIRGQRYFGPSQMNFFKLLVHSFSIIAVFKGSVIVRSVLFLTFYLFFVFSNLSIVTLFPIFIILIFLFLIFKVSSRENIEALNNSLENINNIDVLSDLNNR